jgi:hypothetical protein
MATNSNATAGPREWSHQQVSILKFASNNSGPETLRRQAEALLTNENIVPDILGLSKEDQEKFISKVDEVR